MSDKKSQADDEVVLSLATIPLPPQLAAIRTVALSVITLGNEIGALVSGATELYDKYKNPKTISPTTIPSAGSDIFGKGISELEQIKGVDTFEAFQIGETLRKSSEVNPIQLEQLLQAARDGIEVGISEAEIGEIVKTASDFSVAFNATTKEDTTRFTKIIGDLKISKELNNKKIKDSFNAISIASKETNVDGVKILEAFSAIEDPKKFGDDVENVAALTAVFIDEGESAKASANQTTRFLDGLNSLNIKNESSRKKLESLGISPKKFADEMKKGKKEAINLLLLKLKGKKNKKEIILELFKDKNASKDENNNFADDILGMLDENGGNVLNKVDGNKKSFDNRLNRAISFSSRALQANQIISKEIDVSQQQIWNELNATSDESLLDTRSNIVKWQKVLTKNIEAQRKLEQKEKKRKARDFNNTFKFQVAKDEKTRKQLIEENKGLDQKIKKLTGSRDLKDQAKLVTAKDKLIENKFKLKKLNTGLNPTIKELNEQKTKSEAAFETVSKFSSKNKRSENEAKIAEKASKEFSDSKKRIKELDAELISAGNKNGEIKLDSNLQINSANGNTRTGAGLPTIQNYYFTINNPTSPPLDENKIRSILNNMIKSDNPKKNGEHLAKKLLGDPVATNY